MFIGFLIIEYTSASDSSAVVPIIIGFHSNDSSIHLSISIKSHFIIIPSFHQGDHCSFKIKKLELVGTFSDYI